MSNLEQIVRPAQTKNIRPLAISISRVPSADPTAAVLTWGEAGNSIFTLQANVKQTVKNDRNTETKRTFDVVRITNPDDETQFIDTEVMTSYQARNTISRDRIELRFAKPEASDNIQILKRNQTRTTSE